MEMARASLATPPAEKVRNTPHQEFKTETAGSRPAVVVWMDARVRPGHDDPN